MALSGSIKNEFRNGYGLEIDWSATQSISNNTSTVTAKLYLVSYGSYYEIYSSATKYGNITINGDKHNFSVSGANLSAYQRKHLSTFTTTVPHNSDGTKSFSISADFGIEVTLSSVFFNTVSVSKSNIILNTIPRASSLNSSPSFTAGNDLNVRISRASTDFTHTVNLFVNGKQIKKLTGVRTNSTFNFSFDENESIFNELNGASRQDTKVEILTYSNGKLIGEKSYTGTVTSPKPSTSYTYPNFEIGDSLFIEINRANTAFSHTVRVIVGTTTIKTFYGINSSVNWTPTNSEIDQMYNLTPNSKEIESVIEIETFYSNEKVRNTTRRIGTATVVNAIPSFSDNFIYKDTNVATLDLTDNNQYIIQDISDLLVTIPVSARAEATNGASMVEYVATLNGLQITEPYSSTNDVNFDFGHVDAETDKTLEIKAIDSRGNTATESKTITIIPYKKPVLNASARRKNGFETETTLRANGSISPIIVDGTNKNSLQLIEYRYKAHKNTNWSSWISFQYSTTYENYTASNVILNLNTTQSYDIEFRTTDKVGSTTVYNLVTEGVPILFMDSEKRSVSIGQFPANNNTLEISGDLRIEGDIYKNGELFEIKDTEYLDDLSVDNLVVNNSIEIDGLSIDVNDISVNNISVNNDVSISDSLTVDNSITAPFVHIDYIGDISQTTKNKGLILGDLYGQHITIDSNELGSFNDTDLSTLHLNPDGGTVAVNVNGTSGNALEVSGKLVADTFTFSNPSSISFDQYGNITGNGGSFVINANNGNNMLVFYTDNQFTSGRYFEIVESNTGGSGTEPIFQPSTTGGFGYVGTSSRPFFRQYSYSFTNASSEDLKADIKDTDKKSMKEFVKGLRIREYRSNKGKELPSNASENAKKRVMTRNINQQVSDLAQEKEVEVDDKQIGLVIEELDLDNAMAQKILDEDLAGIDIYAFTSMLAGALQDNLEETDQLKQENNNLVSEIDELKEQVKILNEKMDKI